MGCRLIQKTLVAYYFGTADPAARDATDAHLIACGACLAAFLEIKRHAEAPPDDAPSDALFARLRGDIEAAVRPRPFRRIRGWLTGPVPRYHLASVVALLWLVAALVTRLATRTPEPPVGTRLDTSRTASSHSGAF